MEINKLPLTLHHLSNLLKFVVQTQMIVCVEVIIREAEEMGDTTTTKRSMDISTISTVWLTSHGTDAANSVLVERAAQQINALQKSSQG